MKHVHDAAVMISLASSWHSSMILWTLLVDLLGNFFTVASGMCQISSDKYLIAIISVGDQSKLCLTYHTA